MKSTSEQLESRGYVTAGEENSFMDLSADERIVLLKSKKAFERTIGARLLFKKDDSSAMEPLFNALRTETKLYTKIEISGSIVSYGKDSVNPLIALLGKIGKNQYKEIPIAQFKKNNYPLPRDISARILIRIGKDALSELVTCLNSDDSEMLSEAIVAIGFICYYNRNDEALSPMIECFKKNYVNKLIRWKIYRAMSAFPGSTFFLREQMLSEKNEILRREIVQSRNKIKLNSSL